MFDNLTDRLQGVLQQVQGKDKLTAEHIDKALVEVRRALLEADVELTVIKTFLSRVRAASVGERIVKGITPSQKFIQIVNDELVNLLGGEVKPLSLNNSCNIIMLLGLQGVGKTTTAAKLALTLKNQDKKVLLVALDLQRPAAIDQLHTLADSIQVDIYSNKNSKSVLDVAKEALEKKDNYDVVIFDTAGRLQVDSELMAELLLLDKKYKPQEKLLVIDALMGQESSNVAQTFDTQIGITGAILSKADGDSRGGAALSIAESTGKYIKYMGLGERVNELEVFDPARIADRILGFGDIVSLVQSVEKNIEESEAKELEASLKKGNLTFETFLKMQRLISKIGGMSSIFNLMGLGNKLGINKDDKDKLLNEGQNKLKHYEFIINSMTQKERDKPELLESSQGRIKRIAQGSGHSTKEVKKFIGEFMQMRKMMGMLGPMMGGNMPTNPMDMLNMSNNMHKQQKQEKKQTRKSPFGKGGAFMKF